MLGEEILIVNDGSLLLQMMGGLLESKGYHLNLTDSPEEALLLLSTRHVVLVVIKLNDQQTDRLSVMHMAKEFNGGSKLLIMGDAEHLPAEIFEIGADDYILLPCRTAEIWRRVLLSLEAAPSKLVSSQENGLAHPVNRRVLNNLELMFHDLGRHLTSVNEGLEILRRKINGKMDNEVEIIFQEAYRRSRTLISITEEYLQKFQNQNSVLEVKKLVDIREDVVEPIIEKLQSSNTEKGAKMSDSGQARKPKVRNYNRGPSCRWFSPARSKIETTS